jgi:hypothetical protein
LKETGGLVELSLVSNVVRSISGTQVGKARIYMPEQIWEDGRDRLPGDVLQWLQGEWNE